MIKKLSPWIALSLPAAMIMSFARVEPLGRLQFAQPECWVKQQYIPVSAPPVPKRVPLLPIPESQLLPQSQSHIQCQDEQLWGYQGKAGDSKALLSSIDHSLQYLQTDKANSDYKNYLVPGITRDRVLKSLKRFRELILKSHSAKEFQAAVSREFVFYQSVGKDKTGKVLFTAYYEPLYAASRVQTAEYRYPIYRLPPDLASWPRPHPTRLELEGADGLQGAKGKLKGLELFWLRDRLEAFDAQVEGSARLQLTDGTQTTAGYAGNTAYDYVSIGKELANDGKLPLEGMTMPIIERFFIEHPQELNVYVPRNPSFVFFQENHGGAATGSIRQALTGERSIATDKSIMPPGALALLHTTVPFANSQGEIGYRTVSRFVLDQDTGGAIKGAGRVDYFLGTGQIAGDRAGVTVSRGELYYLLLKES